MMRDAGNTDNSGEAFQEFENILDIQSSIMAPKPSHTGRSASTKAKQTKQATSMYQDDDSNVSAYDPEKDLTNYMSEDSDIYVPEIDNKRDNLATSDSKDDAPLSH